MMGGGANGAAQAKRRGRGSGRPLLALTLGHATVDTYVGLIPVLYPLLIERFSLDLATVGLVTLAYVGASSLSQPLFGWVADRYGARVLRFSLVWTVFVFAAVGFAPSFEALLLLAGAAGLGSGAYHPFGAVGVAAVADEERRSTATSIYVMGGYLGVAVGPLIGAALVPTFGLRGAALTILPGLAASAWLLRDLGSLPRGGEDGVPDPHAGSDGAIPGTATAARLAAVVIVTMSQVWVLYAVQSFTPTWYDSMGYGPSFYGPLLATILLATGLGSVLCGALADRFGKRAVIAGSLVVSVPALLSFASFAGPAAFFTGAMVGISCASTGPLLLVMAQQLLPGREGLASGVVLGLGFLTGAVGVPVTGLFAEAFGLREAMLAQAAVAAATVPLVLLLPGEGSAAGRSRG